MTGKSRSKDESILDFGFWILDFGFWIAETKNSVVVSALVEFAAVVAVLAV